MNNRRKPILGVAILVCWALASYQGWRVLKIDQAESFYRWIIATSDEYRLTGLAVEEEDAEGIGTEKGEGSEADEQRLGEAQELFDTILAKADELLPAPPASDDAGLDDTELPKLLVYVRDSYDLKRVWNMARSDELAAERELFLNELRPRLNVGVLYGAEGNVSLANMFFGFRKMAANFVWLQVDRYWHEGALFRMVPLMRTTVTLDPHFVDAYLLGAWHLAYNITADLPETPEGEKVYDPKVGRRLGKKEEFYYYAADFLKDGIKNNPKDYRLYFDLGYRVYHEKLHDNGLAAKYLREAVRYRHDVWVPRTLYRILELNHEYEDALKGWQDYLKRYPDNLVAPRFIARNEAHLAERDARLTLSQADEARAQGRTQEADELEQKGMELWDKARDMWKALYEGEDSNYGMARLVIMNAEQLRRAGKYYDAVAILDGARYESGDLFDEISNIIIEIKQEGNIPLSLSERMELERRKEAAQYEAEDAAKREGPPLEQ